MKTYCREGLSIVGRLALNSQFRLWLYLLLKELTIQLYFEFFESALCHGISFVHCVSQLYWYNLQVSLSFRALPNWEVTVFSNFKIKLEIHIDLHVEVLLQPVLFKHYTALKWWRCVCWMLYANESSLAGVQLQSLYVKFKVTLLAAPPLLMG